MSDKQLNVSYCYYKRPRCTPPNIHSDTLHWHGHMGHYLYSVCYIFPCNSFQNILVDILFKNGLIRLITNDKWSEKTYVEKNPRTCTYRQVRNFESKLDTIWAQNLRIYFPDSMFGIINMGTFHGLSKFEGDILTFMHDTEFENLSFVNKARTLRWFTYVLYWQMSQSNVVFLCLSYHLWTYQIGLPCLPRGIWSKKW